MEDKQHSFSNVIYNGIHEYKTCAGKDCNNEGKYCLKILYIKKSGWFCDGCKNDLLRYGLVEKLSEGELLEH